MFDKEMQAALISDGEKLAALTGEDNGPLWLDGDHSRYCGPFYYMGIPLDMDGQGPCDPEDTWRTSHEVWDQLCLQVCTCRNEDTTRTIAAALNRPTAAP